MQAEHDISWANRSVAAQKNKLTIGKSKSSHMFYNLVVNFYVLSHLNLIYKYETEHARVFDLKFRRVDHM